MGGEWAKAVKKIFDKKYSDGRGKLVDAMKDPETKALHQEMLGKKPMKMTKMNNKMNNKMKKTQKYKKTMRGGVDEEEDVTSNGNGDKVGSRFSFPGGKRSNKNRSNKKGKKARSNRKK